MSEPTRVEDIFLAALQKGTPADRAAYLDEVCRDDPELRQRVERLLEAHAKAGGFLEPLGPPEGQATVQFTSHEEEAGTVIAGRYKLLERIGEGGQGVVWVAEQLQPVRRKVAVKLIPGGMDSRAVVARFEAERQALALMDHPNIAKVLDGGLTEQGRPYFVMEYIKGEPITAYCDRHRLTVRQRLELFIPVCQAVQHAHIKGIVHRDLKPSNILVAPFDDVPVPKVIDFGVAKALHQPLTELTLHTEHNAVLGTWLYMAPEQARVNNLDVDTRADVYALGVVLYELLTGATPLDGEQVRRAALDEVVRLIREAEPSRPSVKLATLPTRASVAALRQIEPVKLSRLMSQELDWVVLKCLEKERGRRYETASALAADLGRYLADEAVTVHPPSVGYRLRKFARRNRGAVAAGLAVALALAVGAAVATGFGLRERSARLAEANAREEANHQAQAANAARTLADERAEAERKAREAEAVALAKLKQTVDDLLGATAVGIARPSAIVGVGEDVPAPTNGEIEAWWFLARTDQGGLRQRFVAESSRDPALSAGLRTRAPIAVQSTSGTDCRIRDQVEALLAEALARPGLSWAHRMDLAITLSALGDLHPETALAASITLIQGIRKIKNEPPSVALGQLLGTSNRTSEFRAVAEAVAAGVVAVASAVHGEKPGSSASRRASLGGWTCQKEVPSLTWL